MGAEAVRIADVVPIEVIASSAGSGIAIAIGGIIAVIAISAVFYVVGRSEDRERELAAERAAAAESEPEPEPQAPPEQRSQPHESPAAGEPHPRLSRPPRTRKRR
jgi:hypothetical protein